MENIHLVGLAVIVQLENLQAELAIYIVLFAQLEHIPVLVFLHVPRAIQEVIQTMEQFNALFVLLEERHPVEQLVAQVVFPVSTPQHPVQALVALVQREQHQTLVQVAV